MSLYAVNSIWAAWLWRELDHNYRYTVVGCGTCLESGAPRDKWSNYRDAYTRLREKLDKVPKLIFASGDIHRNDFKTHRGFFEVISSGVGRKEDGRPLNNYGIIEFGTNRVTIRLRGRHRRTRLIRASTWTLE